MDEGDRSEIGRIKRIGYRRIGPVRKDAGVADVNPGLPAKLHSERNRVEHRTGESFVDEVGLVEKIVAVGRMVISREIERGVGRIHRSRQGAVTGIDVLIKFLVVGEHRRVLHRQSISEIVFDKSHRLLHVGSCNV